MGGAGQVIQNLFGKSSILEKSLNATWLRNDVIAQNIANDDTPMYKRKDVAFEDVLNASVNKLEAKVTNKRHIPFNTGNIDNIQPQITESNSDVSMRIDGNNVDIDNEMASLAKNTIKYNTLVQMINGSYSKIKNVISEGRR